MTLLARLVVRWKLRRCAVVGEGVRVRGRVHVHGGGSVRIGDRVVLDGGLVPIELHAMPSGSIVLEEGVEVGPGVSIEARRSVRVGAHASLRAFAKVLDTHFHGLSDRSSAQSPRPVTVEPSAIVGEHAILLPGAHIGHGADVRARAVVSRVVPAECVAAGVPATVRRS